MKNKIKHSSELLDDFFKVAQQTKKISSEENNFSDTEFYHFSFHIEKEKIDFIRNYVIMKRRSSLQHFHYNQSNVLKDGIQLMRENNANLESRPKELKIPTRAGTAGRLPKGTKKMQTSFFISGADRDFIYDFIYNKMKDGGRYTKSQFMGDLLSELSKTVENIKKAAK